MPFSHSHVQSGTAVAKLDRDFGPFFLKFCSYFPYNAKLCWNGHEYAKCQLRQEGIDYKALDNGFVSCADLGRLQTICDQLGPLPIDGWLRRCGWRGCPIPTRPRIVKRVTAMICPSTTA